MERRVSRDRPTEEPSGGAAGGGGRVDGGEGEGFRARFGLSRSLGFNPGGVPGTRGRLGLVFGCGLGLVLLLGFGLESGSALRFDLVVMVADRSEACGGAAIAAEGVGVREFGEGGYGAVDGVGDDLFDELLFVLFASPKGWPGLGEVGCGDLETVEEEACAAGVDGVRGDAAEDFADGELDGAAVFGQREVEGGLAGAARAGVGDGLAGGVVEVAEVFPAERGAAAAAAFGVDVAALEALRCFGLV